MDSLRPSGEQGEARSRSGFANPVSPEAALWTTAAFWATWRWSSGASSAARRVSATRAPDGRGHWHESGFAFLAGGGLRTGQVIGETDARGERPRFRRYTPQHVLATLYHVLGIDPAATTLVDHSGRPRYLLDRPERIVALG